MRRRTKIWSAIGAIVLAAFLLGGFTNVLRDGLMAPLVENDSLRQSDVIIVLGSGTRKRGDRLPPQAKQRVLGGLQLYRDGWAPNIIISGGVSKKTGYIESKEMLAYAASQGGPVETITAETRSTSTYENAVYSLEIMRQHDWKTALVVTSPYHTWRACRIFRAQGADVRCVVAPFSLLPQRSAYEHLTDTRSVIREYGAVVYNWVQGQL